jgi:hypothetical protein
MKGVLKWFFHNGRLTMKRFTVVVVGLLWIFVGGVVVAAPSTAILRVSSINEGTLEICFNQPGTNYTFLENIVQVSDEPFDSRSILRDTSANMEVFRGYGDTISSPVSFPGEEICLEAGPLDLLEIGGLFPGSTYYVGHIGQDDCSNPRRRCDISQLAIEDITMPLIPNEREVRVSWDCDDDERIHHYTVVYGEASGSYNNSFSTEEKEIIVNGLTPGQWYFAVQACTEDESLCSEFSEEVGINLQ